MAFVDGNEILFSAEINMGEGGGGVTEYNETKIYNKGDLVSHGGLLYTPKANNTVGVLPTDETAWEDLTSGKQDKLPENEGSSSHRVFVASPKGFKADGVETPYYLKRIAGYDGTGKSSSNGDTGVVTKANRDAKVAEGIIAETDGAYNNYVEHDEPFAPSIACRDQMGRLVIEDGVKPFHAVNKRQLEEVYNRVLDLDGDLVNANIAIDEISNSHFPKVSETFTLTASNSQGWYRIATVSGAGVPASGIFRVTCSVQSGGFWSDIIFIASRAFTAKGKILVLNHQKSHNGEAINNIRMGYTTSEASSPAYIDVCCIANSSTATDTVRISVELIDNINNPNEVYGKKWSLVTPTKESDTEPYEYARVEYMQEIGTGSGTESGCECVEKKLYKHTLNVSVESYSYATKDLKMSCYYYDRNSSPLDFSSISIDELVNIFNENNLKGTIEEGDYYEDSGYYETYGFITPIFKIATYGSDSIGVYGLTKNYGNIGEPLMQMLTSYELSNLIFTDTVTEI